MEAEAYVALSARYETPLFSYAARMLGGLRDGERCLIAALTDGWRELDGGAEPARPQEWFTALMREHCFDELARRAPAGPEDTSTAPAIASRSPPTPRSPPSARPIATCCCCATCTGSTPASSACSPT